MKIVINLVVGLVLFAGALIGGLAATGRLNHEGTANIPLLGSFFPEPQKPVEPEAGAEAADAHGTPAAAAADGVHAGGEATPQDASATPEGQSPQGEEKPRRSKTGRSVVEPEKSDKPAEGGGHGEAPAGGSGEEPAAGHGEQPAGEHGDASAAKTAEEHGKGGEHAAVKDFAELQDQLANDRKNKYAPGGYFTFQGMPAGLTPEQINDAWNRVQGLLADIDKRKQALDLREQDLQLLADDIDRRLRVLAEQRLALETKMRQLDDRIAKFQEQVKLVRNDEVAALKNNAKTMETFDASLAADLIAEQWRTEKGQEEVLKMLSFMNKEKESEILQLLPKPVVQDLMNKRLRVSREATPSATPGK
jgi:hypothetical protein